MYSVKVELLNQMTCEKLEDIIKKYLNAGYSIQNSRIELQNNEIQGVYVFVKKEKAETQDKSEKKDQFEVS